MSSRWERSERAIFLNGSLHAAGFFGADLVEGLIHVGDDVEAVEDMQGLGTMFADEFQIGLLHVGADEGNVGNDLLSHGVDLTERTMIETPGDDVFDGVENLLPKGAKGGGFLPGQPARPAGQKEHVGFGESPFAIAPGDLLDDDRLAAAASTATAPVHGVEHY